MADYSSFDDVLGELKLSEDELNRLVSEGALRAYKDDGNVKFRRDDVQAMLASNLGNVGSTPAMSPTEVGKELRVADETDETLLDLDEVSEDIDFEDTGVTSVPTIDLGADVGGSDALTDELSFDDDALDLDDGEATLVSNDELNFDDDDLGLETEPLAGLDDADATLVADSEISLDDDELSLEADDLSLDGGGDFGGGFGAPGFVGAPMAAPQIQVQEKHKYVEIVPNEGWGTKVVSILMLIVLIYGVIAVVNSQTGSDTLGTTSVGFNMVRGSSINDRELVKDRKWKDLADNPINAEKWVVADGGASEKGAVFPSETLHRKNDGKARYLEGAK